MDIPVGTLVFWMLVIGLTVGYTGFLIFGERGIAMIPSIATGSAGALVSGVISILIQVFNPLVFAMLGAIGFLFIINSFRQKERTEGVKIQSKYSSS